MSTVFSSEHGPDDPGAPLQGRSELVGYFAAAEKSPDDFRIGSEHEKFAYRLNDLQPIPYEGEGGVEWLLHAIADDESESHEGGWRKITEGGRTIALQKRDASITLEPGGQIELSGAPLLDVHAGELELARHFALLERVCAPRGIGFLGMGFHPSAALEDFPTVPKSRYALMQRYMPRRGTRGLDMMKRTCTVQANFDYQSEAHMVSSFRTSLAIAPIATALFANSPFVEGHTTGALSERSRVWLDTDPDRSGFPAVVFEPGFGYERWVDYALSVPMYFIRRGGVLHDVAGADFRTFLRDGWQGHRATLRDFEDHLTTVFTEVRLKRYLEVRSADCGDAPFLLALPALYEALFYDEVARDAIWALMDEPSATELASVQRDAAARGLQAEYRGKALVHFAEALLDIAAAGLERYAASTGRADDRVYLQPLREVVEHRCTQAERWRHRFEHAWSGDIRPLFREAPLLRSLPRR